MASHVFVSIVLYEILKAFRMLWKSCLGKADKHPPTPPFPFPHAFSKPRSVHTRIQILVSERSPTRTDATLKKQKNINVPQTPDPTLKKLLRESPKGGESFMLKLSFADQILEYFC